MPNRNSSPHYAVIGYGYWGQKVYQSLAKHVAKSNIVVVDPYLAQPAPHLRLKTLPEILQSSTISHVCIVTPEETHFEIALRCLEHDKHVFIEKPLCLTNQHAKKLLTTARKHKRIVQVDYIFLHDPYIQKIKSLIKNGEIGTLIHIESVRHSVHINKPAITVFDDLATHDIYLGKYFFSRPVRTLAVKKEMIGGKQINQGQVTYFFGNKTLSASYSWIQPLPARTLTFIGTKKTLIWDKNNQNILLFENQQKRAEIPVTFDEYPLDIALKEFVTRQFSEKDFSTYRQDVATLEKIKTLSL